VCLSDEGRAALGRGLASHFPGFPDDVKSYRWKQVTQVDFRTVKRMLTPGEAVRHASVLTVFSDLGVAFDSDAYLGPPAADERPQAAPVATAAKPAEETSARFSWRLIIPALIMAVVAIAAVLFALKSSRQTSWSTADPNYLLSQKTKPKPERWMVFYDDFTRDTTLDPHEWTVNGPAVTASLIAHAAVVAPQIAFDPNDGLCVSGVDGNNQKAGIQTVQSFEPPFTATAECMVAQANAGALGLSITNASGSSGVGIIGGQGTTDDDTGFVYTSPQDPGGLWGLSGRLSPIPPDSEVSYTLAIRVDGRGNATVAASSGGHILGQATQYAGPGPYYVVIGQSAAGQQNPGPNRACWLALQVIHG
jgi:hypothetical protein